MAVTVLSVCCGIGVSAGILGLASSLRARRSEEYRERTIWRRKPTSWAVGNSSWSLRLALGAILAVLVAALTRWPAAAVFAGLAGISLPSLVRMTRGTDVTARTEAIALWTELLRDTLAAASGLSQSIVSTALVAPEPIQKEVQALAFAPFERTSHV